MAERMVALLRGINVGKAKRIAMADLRALLEELGYTEVRSHLNSGNLVFTSTPKLAKGVEARLHDAIADRLDVDCAVLVRTAAALRDALAAEPFGSVADDPARYLIGFLSKPVSAAKARTFEEQDYGDEQIRIDGDHAYLWCPSGVNNSQLFKTSWEKALGVSVTARNLNTVRKLVELADPES